MPHQQVSIRWACDMRKCHQVTEDAGLLKQQNGRGGGSGGALMYFRTATTM